MGDDTPSAVTLLDGIDLDRDDPEIVRTVTSILRAPDYPQLVSSFLGEATRSPPERAVKFINAIDKALGYDDGSSENKLRRALRKMCGDFGILPSSYYLDGDQMRKANDVPFASGGYSDVWRGLYKGESVSIKAFRVYTTDDVRQLTKAWCKEVALLRGLSHPNIHPFIGIVSTESLPLCVVSKWMRNGNISEFIRRDPESNRRQLLVDIIRGMNYLHSQNVVHGNLKGPNILIDDDKSAAVSDFGLAAIYDDAASDREASSHASVTGTIRWMSPERLGLWTSDSSSKLSSNPTRVTKESDMYSISMVVIELFTGYPPFSDTPDAGVILKLSQQKRPKKPERAVQLGLTNPIWETVETCWKTEPSDRLTASQVLKIWEKEINGVILPEATEANERRRSQALGGDGPHKNTPWWRFLCCRPDEQYVQ